MFVLISISIMNYELFLSLKNKNVLFNEIVIKQFNVSTSNLNK